MTQQINLFNPLFLKQRKYFSALAMVWGLGIVVAAMAVFYAWVFMTQIGLDRQMAKNEADFRRQTQELTAVAASIPPAQAEAKVEQETKDLQAQIAARNSLFERLQGGNAQQQAAYSDYLRALARQMVNGVWLTRVHISESGEDLSLTGRATQADLIPQLVRNLNQEPLLRGRPFESLGMKRVVPAVPGVPAGTPPGAPAGAAAAPPVRVPQPYFEFNLASRAGGESPSQPEAQASNVPPAPVTGVAPAPGLTPVPAPPVGGGSTVKPS